MRALAVPAIAIVAALGELFPGGDARAQEPYAGEIGQQLCAGGIACTGVSPEDARVSLGYPDAESATEAAIEASFLIDEAIWMCAADGCTDPVDAALIRKELGLTLEQVQAIIRLRPDLARMMGGVPLGPTAKAPMLAGRYWVIPNRNRGALPGELVFSGNGADPVFEPGRDWVRSSLVRGRYEAEGLVITIAGTTAHDMVGRYVFTTADCDPPSGTCRAFVEGGGYDLILLPNTM